MVVDLLLRTALAAHVAALLGRPILDVALLRLRLASVTPPRSGPPSTSSLRTSATIPGLN